jgi:hypothetical protein
MLDRVNARKIFISKCAEYSPTNETIGAALSLLPLWGRGRGLNRWTIKNRRSELHEET